jgi:RHS repeat-associated protein
MEILFPSRPAGIRNWIERIFIGALITSFVFSPIAQAFAQSTTDAIASSGVDTSTVTPPVPASSPDSSSVSSPDTTDDQSANPNTPSNDNSNSNSTSNTDGTNNANSSASPSAQSAPLFTQGSGSPGPGSVATDFFNQSQFKIDQNTGAADITYPIGIPPGRNNLQPDLDLVYNSQNIQLGGIFGEGWSISIPYIQRFNIDGVDNLYSTSTTNYFTSSLDGELSTTTVSGNYIARTENGTFNKYTFSSSTDSWTMTDKNGIQYTFGSTSSSQQSDPNNATHVYKWMLNTITDTNNNTVVYTYFKNSGQIYPSSTIYTGNGSSTGIFEVDFLLASSTDNGTSSATGFAVNSNYRVSDIEAKVNGTWVRQYNLGYGTGDNGSTTLLNWIAESGMNASGTVVSEPSSTFSYQTQTPGWVPDSTWIPPISFTATSSADDGVRVADVNGDGLPDVIQGYTNASGATSTASYLNNGADWTVTSTWDPPISFSNNGVDQGVRIVDVNGDGLPDIIQGFTNSSGVTSTAAYINTGSGWVVSSTWDPPISFSNNGADTGARIADVNGDGLPDIIQAYTDTSGTAHYAAYINNGHGWTSNPSWNPPTTFISSSTTDTGARLADVNGDGLPDIIQGFEDSNSVNHFAAYMNTGDGWSTSTVSIWDPPVVFSNNGADTGVRIADINGDGLPDIIQAYTDSGGANHYAAYLNNGAGWDATSSWDPPVSLTLNGTDNGTRVVNVTGSGLPDIIQAYTDSSGVEHTSAYTNSNKFRADLLTGITYPQGGSSTLAYESILQITDDNGNVLNGVPYPVYIVSQVSNNDGLGDISSSSYVYYGGTYYTNGPFDHEFAGFTQVKETDGAGNVTKTYYDTSNGSNTSTGQYADNFWKIGKAYRVENYDNAGNLYKITITKWDSTSTGGNAAYVFPDNTLELDYDGLSTHEDSADSYTWNETDGNQTQQIQWGQVTGSSTGAFATSSLGYTTNYSYASSTGSNVIGKVSDEALLNQSSTKIQETQYYYDGLALGSIGAGNLTTQDDWISGTSYATTTRNTYNSYGLVTQTLDPRNNTTTYSYDAYNMYPATTTNALSQITNNQYDYSTGKVTQTIDANGNPFQTTYDGLGRPLMILDSNPMDPPTLATTTTYIYTDTSGAVSVQEIDQLYYSTSTNTYSYYDGLGRLIQTRKSAEDSGIYKVTDYAYNNVGLLATQSLPYFGSGTTKTSATTTSALFTNYTYDPLGRVLTTTNAVGTVSNYYDNWKTTITDANGNTKDEYHDGYGNLVQVGEHNGSSTYATLYSYDGLKDLLNITDANGNVRNFAYDGLARVVSSTDLHASTDTTYGIWNYTYDAAGNLTQQVDPKNQSTTYAYDVLNRVTSESSGGQTQLAYTYDTCTDGIGRLCIASSSMAITSSTYNSVGEVIDESKTIGSSTYTTGYAYGRQKNITDITNPDNSIIHYDFGSAGLVADITYQPSGGNATSVISNFDYSPLDQVALEDYANGMVVENIYDPLQLYRLIGKITTDNQGEMGPMAGGGAGGGLTPNGGGGGLTTSQTITEPYTGTVASFTVPIGVTGLMIGAYGAQGGTGGGLGGVASGTLSVTSGTTYYFAVGQQGGPAASSGGGPSSGAGGGGMTWFSSQNSFDTSHVILVAGGGGGVGGGGSTSSGGANSGGAGGYGGGGNGGSTNGNLAGSGGGGSGWWGGQADGGEGAVYGPGSGGVGGGLSGGTGTGPDGLTAAGGTQTLGYAQGSGSPGSNNIGAAGTSGGGGGSSYISSVLTSTSTASGVNSGNGYLTIVEYPTGTVYAPYLTSQNQYHLNGVTQLNRGSSTTEGGVMFKAMLNSSGTLGLQLQVEVQPLGRNFTNIPNVTSTPFMVPNQIATTTFYGLNGSYHWQAQIVDVFGNTSGWQRFSTSTYTTDFVITSQTQPTNATETYSGSVGSFTVPSDVAKLTITSYGAEGATSSLSQSLGGYGGETAFTILLAPSTTIYYSVGGQGDSSVGAGDMTWISPTSTFSTSTVWIIAGGGGNGGTQVPSGCGISTGGGSGGAAGGLTGTTGGSGGSNGYGSAAGGGGGSQTSGGGGGAGGHGYSNNNGGNGNAAISTLGGIGGGGNGCNDGSGGAGGSGYWGGGGGGGGGAGSTSGNGSGGGGGGGGSSYLLASTTTTLTNTSTLAGVNIGNGYIQIVEYHIAPIIASLNQYHLDGVTPISDGGSTNENGVVLGATLTSNTTTSIQLQAEVQPAGTPFTNTPNVTSSAYITPGTFATTSFIGSAGAYHWQIRGVDTQGDMSAWLPFNQSTSSTDFIINRIYFTYPAYGTTTPQFSNWLMSARNVTSTRSYQVQVNWGLTQPNQATSSINASGTALLSGVSVPKTLFSGDYSLTGDPVGIVAQGSLYDITSTSTLLATTSVSFDEDTIPGTSNCGSTDVQCIAYTYDPDGNITKLVDGSVTNAAITVNYTYDSLNRLTSASSSNAASGQNYLEAFSYDPVGNILTGPAGTYAYAGNQGSGDTDPDAVTSIIPSTGPVLFDASSSYNASVGSSTYTWPLTVTSTANRVLLVSVLGMPATDTSTAASYNGTAMTLLENNGNVNTEMQVWYLKNPASGTHNVSVTFATSSWEGIAVAEDFANAGGTGGISAVLGDGTSTLVSISSAKGNDVVDFLNVSKATSSYQAIPVAASGQNLLISTTTVGNWAQGAVGYVVATGTSAINEKYTLAASSSFWQQYEIEVVAATSTATSTFTYDNDGNLLSNGNATNTWNYRNQLISSFNVANGTSTYAYDYLGQRASVANASVTTYYPETTYTVNSTTRTKNIFANGLLVATVQDATTTPPLTLDTSASLNFSTASATFTFPLTVTSTANRLLLFAVTGMPSWTTTTAVSYNGTAMTLLQNSGNINTEMQSWYLVNPASGTHNISITMATSTSVGLAVAVDFANAVGGGNLANALSQGTSTSVSVSSTKGNMMLDFLNVLDSTTPDPTPLSGQYLLISSSTSGTHTTQGAVGYAIATTTGTLVEKYGVSTSSFWQQYEIEVSQATTMATSSVTSYVLTDNLGGTNLVTNTSGTVVETLDYYPFGAIRIDNSTGTPESRKFIGMPYDSQTQLSLLGARYYNGAQGQFISQDPAFLGNPKDQNLSDPQSLNSYSYAEDNPITDEDPSGKTSIQQQIIGLLQQVVGLLQQEVSSVAGSTVSIAGQAANTVKTQTSNGLNALNNGLSTVSTYINSNPVIGIGLIFVDGGDGGEGTGEIGAAGENSAAGSIAGESAVTNESGEPLYRGGSTFESGLRVDPNGKITSGYSLNVNPNSPNVVNNGGAYGLQGDLPQGLKIVQQGTDPGHYQILPVNPNMPVDEYQSLVNQIKLTPTNNQ